MNKTDYREFCTWYKLLMENAPKGYIPHLFALYPNDKAPNEKITFSRANTSTPSNLRWSWKEKHARLTGLEAVELLYNGGNVGIAAMGYDPLVLIDIDDLAYLDQAPKTLTVKTRSGGYHCYGFKKDDSAKINLPTDYGELRSFNQFVVAPGSYVPCENGLTDGVYRVLKAIKPMLMTFDDFPQFFKDKKKENQEKEKLKPILKKTAISYNGKHSALYDLSMSDIVPTAPGKREPHPLHASDTGSNFSIANGGEICHCWRHLVTLNAIQFLCVKSGYMDCLSAGTGHTNSGAGSSDCTGDYGSHFYAWREAKLMGVIPLDDPIPDKAVKYLALKNGFIDKIPEGMIPKEAYIKIFDLDLEKQ